MKKQYLHRIVFCAFWLYFNAFRGILGHIRLFDYLFIFLVPLGIIMLVLDAKVTVRPIQWTILLILPLIITALIDPHIEILIVILKSLMVALYFIIYLKTMRLTIIEFICFTLPFILSVYYFLYPTGYQIVYLSEGRLAGIDEPNFTSLSLILAMCGALSLTIISKKKKIKLLAIASVVACVIGIILTLSRAGFIGAIIVVCVFLVIKKRKWYAGALAAAAVIFILLSSSGILYSLSSIFSRFQRMSGHQDLLTGLLLERPFMESAWNTVQKGAWFIGGGPQLISKWSFYNLAVPHNSLLDIGIQFGKANFYFYSLLVIALLILNLLIIPINFKHVNSLDRNIQLTPMFFLGLLPMYMFLSAGMTMSFIFWMVLGTYPLLHISPGRIMKLLQKSSIVKLKTGFQPTREYDGLIATRSSDKVYHDI